MSAHRGTMALMQWSSVPSPIGPLGIAVDATGLRGIRFGGAPGPVVPASGLAASVAEQLDGYFAGELTDFDLPISVTGGTQFEQAVWRAIAAIPYGEMRTYGEIAADVGDPDSARAVGVACNHNPHPVVVACHRVVGAGNKLVGFGGGLPRKRFLLALEARVRIERTFAG
jgi:methylated-DNA-[protein]-cysteine S-methyltransferase